jgi:hypothetical protein
MCLFFSAAVPSVPLPGIPKHEPVSVPPPVPPPNILVLTRFDLDDDADICDESFTTKAGFPSAQFFLHHTIHITGHAITKLFNINISSISSISSNTTRYGGLYGSHHFSFVFTRYPKT